MSPFRLFGRAVAFALLSFAIATPGALARAFSVVVYNVENLHDVDGVAVYEDYQPGHWTPEHLRAKLANTVAVLAKVDKGAGPDIVAFNEIELDQTPDSTIRDGDYAAWLASVAHTTAAAMLARDPLPPEFAGLPAEAWLLKACADAGLAGYHVAVTDERPGKHEDGRGSAVRNVLFSRFPVTSTRTHPLPNARAILEATLDVDGAPFIVFVNHWKSGAADPATEAIRRANAKVLRKRLDEILRADPHADILIAGDLNSHYNQKQRYREMRVTGINDVLGSQGNELAVRGKERDLYNLWFELPSDQRGSDTYRGEWGTLVHLIVSRGLYDQNGVQYEDGSFAVMKFPGLNANALGLPHRWSRGKAPGGFSDHFPLYARFRTVDTRAKDKWIPLDKPSQTENGPGDVIRVETAPGDLFANAIAYKSLPAGTDIRDGSYTGRIFLVEAPCYVNERGHVKVKVGGLEYDVFAHQKELRDEMRAKARAGKLDRFYGALGQYRGDWQFVLHGKEWLR
jgi:Predicted extracellular nuclease